jgi:hypothetical protein
VGPGLDWQEGTKPRAWALGGDVLSVFPLRAGTQCCGQQREIRKERPHRAKVEVRDVGEARACSGLTFSSMLDIIFVNLFTWTRTPSGLGVIPA